MKLNNKIVSTVIFIVLGVSIAYGQNTKDYIESKEYPIYIKRADSLYKVKDYINSGLAFSEAFKSNGFKGLINDRYNAARSWSLANIADSAFFQLFRIAEKAYFKDYDRVVKEEDFITLHADNRWSKLLELLKQNKAFNFGFERINNLEALPNSWFRWDTKDFDLRIDSVEKHSGKYSVKIEATEDIKEKSFGCIAYSIPAIYKGKTIEVKAYIKFENTDKPIGLLLRIDGPVYNKSLEFDNMQKERISGTKDWTLYSVKLPLPKKATKIYIGVLLSGSGKLWADDFQILIDGIDINSAELK